jgi:hypothetical protein
MKGELELSVGDQGVQASTDLGSSNMAELMTPHWETVERQTSEVSEDFGSLARQKI